MDSPFNGRIVLISCIKGIMMQEAKYFLENGKVRPRPVTQYDDNDE